MQSEIPETEVTAVQVGRDLNAVNVVAVVGGTAPVHVQLPPSAPPLERVWHNVKDPIKSLKGTETFLKELKKFIEVNGKKGNYITIIESPPGTQIPGGNGKTQAIRKFININRTTLNNVIWIDAGSRTRAKDSFIRLAEKELKIPLQDQEKMAKPFPQILKEIYEIIFKQKCLLVFDNVTDSMFETTTSSNGNANEGIHSFLPTATRPYDKGLSIIIIYSNLTGKNSTGLMKIEPAVNFQLANLNMKQSLRVLEKELDRELSIEEKDQTENENTEIDSLRKLLTLCDGNPLMLKYAASFIEQQVKRYPWAEYSFQHFIKDYQEMLNLEINSKSVPSPPFHKVLLNLTQKRLHENHSKAFIGVLAFHIMDVLAFLVAENIPIELLQAIFADFPQDNYQNAIKLLIDYSLIKPVSTHFEIHRLTQETLLEKLETDPEAPICEKLRNIMTSMQEFIQSKSPKSCVYYRDYVLNALSVMNHVNRISKSTAEVGSKLSDFMKKEGTFLNFSNSLTGVVKGLFDQEEWVQIFREISQVQVKSYGETSEEAVAAQERLAFALGEQGNYLEGGKMYMDVIKKRLDAYGWHDPVNLGLKLLQVGRDVQGPNSSSAAMADMFLNFMDMLNGPAGPGGYTGPKSNTPESSSTSKQTKPHQESSSKDQLDLD